MSDIEFSSMLGNRASLLFDQFEAATRHRVNHLTFNWEEGWDRLLSVSLHNLGPDVSHIGSTWLGSLESMESLHTFSEAEIENIAARSSLLPSAWQIVQIPPNEQQLCAIPWTADTRLIYYRRDILKKARVDETTAFTTQEAFFETLDRLQSAGIEYPLLFSMIRCCLHSAAPWVWANGGDYRTPDLQHLTMTEPRTLEALIRFFRLQRYVNPDFRGLKQGDIGDVYARGQVAVAYLGYQFLPLSLFHNPPEFGLDNFGVAKIPGIPFIGGNSLVIWKHSVLGSAAIELVRHLVSMETQLSLFNQSYELPVRVEILNQEPFSTHPLFKPVLESLRIGRAFQSGAHWATIEKRLNTVLNQFWLELFARPNLDPAGELTSRLAAASQRIEKTFLGEQG